MGDTFKLSVSMPTDENGMIGRKCPSKECQKYFKLKPGTGMPTDICHCPYCGTEGNASDFLTDEQMEYVESIAVKHVVEPLMDNFKRSVESLNYSTRNSFIQLKFSVNAPNFRVHSYSEKDIETDVTCDSCGLEFGVFGVFASCPDCGRLNVYSVFSNSLETCRKRLLLLDLKDTKTDKGLCEAILQDALSGAISAFDALGKKLREEYPYIFPEKPRNLFQNLISLDSCLKENTDSDIKSRIGDKDLGNLLKLFQVRHIYEHNIGVIDEKFIKKIPSYSYMLGKKYPLERSGIDDLIKTLLKLVSSIESSFENLKANKS